MKRKRTEITIEFEEVIQAVVQQHQLTCAWCPQCGSEGRMISPEEAAAMTQVTVRAVNRRVEAGTVHFIESADGRLWICVNSLSQSQSASEL